MIIMDLMKVREACFWSFTMLKTMSGLAIKAIAFLYLLSTQGIKAP